MVYKRIIISTLSIDIRVHTTRGKAIICIKKMLVREKLFCCQKKKKLIVVPSQIYKYAHASCVRRNDPFERAECSRRFFFFFHRRC